MAAVNRNQLWSEIIVEELIRSGVEHVCIAPGSRSTPLALAFYAQRERIHIYSHLDERSAAYFALGIGMATGTPAAVLCTSGTAAANFYPAIIEAHQARVPLLVLTADRAHEARESGANQTIDQVKMYGDHVLWAVDVALPESNPAAVTLRSLRTTISRAVATTKGQLNLRKGPVHLNLPFRKPLEPVAVASDNVEIPKNAAARNEDARFAEFGLPSIDFNTSESEYVASLIYSSPNGLIYCGQGTPGYADYKISRLAKVTGFPVLVDGLADMRFSGYEFSGGVISAYDSYLTKAIGEPDILIRFGNAPTSTALINYFMGLENTQVIHFNDVWADDSHHVSYFSTADPGIACTRLTQNVPIKSNPSTWKAYWDQIDQTAWDIIERELKDGEFFDGAAVAMLIEKSEIHGHFFFGNSLPVRHLDQFAKPKLKGLTILANRGASGIDGIISTALGTAAGNDPIPVTLVIGDVSFYHDMNGLLAIKRLGIPIRIILLNNDGGGIFQRLPIKDYDPAFTDLFLTRHGLDFSHAAALYGLDYKLATTREEFEAAIARPITGAPNAQIIELRTDSAHDLARRQEIMATVQAAIAPIIAQWKEQENS
jgi:2-succinyl-5-enolpyruvyl-6-hydroxy-3-cyclohexene-1-carboxylate synthase